LVDILFNLNNQEDWKGFLVHDGIHIDFSDKRKFEELSQSIEKNIVAIKNDFTNNERNENLGRVYFPASIKPLIPT